MVLDADFLYHLLYLLICALGLFVHEFFYSLLVSWGAEKVLGSWGAESWSPRVHEGVAGETQGTEILQVSLKCRDNVE